MLIAPNTTDVSCYFKLQVPITGAPATGLVITALNAVYVRDGALAVTAALTALALPTTAHTDNYGIEVSTVGAPALYRIDFPDAAFVAGVPRVQLGVVGAAIDPAYIEVELAPWLTPITGEGVLAGPTQGAITWAQQKIVANINAEGALHIVNSNAGGQGLHTESYVGQLNTGLIAGQYNYSSAGQGLHNNSTDGQGQYNSSTNGEGMLNAGGTYGIKATGTTAPTNPAWALEATLTKIKKWLQLLFRKDAAIATDNAVELAEINASGGSGAGAVDNTTDSTEAIADKVGAIPIAGAPELT